MIRRQKTFEKHGEIFLLLANLAAIPRILYHNVMSVIRDKRKMFIGSRVNQTNDDVNSLPNWHFHKPTAGTTNAYAIVGIHWLKNLKNVSMF
jgi:hypothetical protein